MTTNTETPNEQKINTRMADLEMQLAFQENTIDALNDALVSQQSQISIMQKQIELMAKKLKNTQEDNQLIPLDQEPPPPHY